MLVSIIIPVYNVEKYLERCIESVFKQTHQELQIILVDDGSTDSSSTMCDHYAKTDNRINVIHKHNLGLGYARNSGLEIAKGEYVFFLDSDDWLPEKAIETLTLIAAEEAFDVIRAVHYIEKNNNRKVTKCDFTEGVVNRSGNKEEKERYRRIKTSSTFGYATAVLYKRKFLLKYGLMFDDNRKIFLEDTLFNLKLFANKPRYYVINIPVYCYCIQDDSLSKKSRPEDAKRLLLLLSEYSRYLSEKKLYEDNLDLMVPLLARHFCFIVTKRLGIEKQRYQEVKKVIKAYGTNVDVICILAHKDTFRYLRMISSKKETIFYSFCLFFLKYKAFGFLATVFVVLRPFLDSYINTHLKI